MTLREMTIAYDAFQLDRWWHTAVISSQLHNLQSIVANIGGKNKPKFKTPSECHPFVESKPRGIKIKPTKEGMDFLMMLGNALCPKQ